MPDTALTNSSRLLHGASISRGLAEFALPILCTNLLQSVIGALNVFWIGRHLGEAALAAVSNANWVMLLVTGASLGVAMASTILVGQSVGAGRLTEAKQITGNSLVFFAASSLPLALLGYAYAETLLGWMQVPASSLPLAVPYLKLQFLAIPTIYIYVLVTSLLRGAGDSKTPFYFTVLSVGIHVVVNPLLIFGVGPIEGAGVVGSAIATVISYSVSLVALIAYLYRRRHPLCIYTDELAYLRVDLAVLRRLVNKGVPMGIELLFASLSGVLMLVFVNRFGVDTTAAFGASLQLWLYIQMPAIAIAMAVSAMAALNGGAQQFNRVRAIARVGALHSMTLTGTMVAVAWLFDTHLFRLFLPAGSPALSIASHINATVAWSFVLWSITATLFGAMRGMGEVTVPMASNVAMLVLRFVLAAVLLQRWQAGALWWSLAVSTASTLPLAIFHYRYGRWRIR